MWRWILLLAATLALSVIGVVYLTKCFHRFSFVKRLGEKKNKISWVVAVVPSVLVLGVFTICINIYSAVVVYIHLMIFWLICDFVLVIVSKCLKKNDKKSNIVYNIEGVTAIVLTIIYMGIGWYNARHVSETDYTFYTSKDLGVESLRVVEIADSHLGVTLDGTKFAREMKKLQKVNPDVVVVAGDFVDDDSYKKDMIEACQALGDLNTKYGVYFIFGNHDKGYYHYRDFTSQELRDELTKNNVLILEDESILIEDHFYIIGRQDRTETDRMDMNTLTKDLDHSKYMILLDHQPNDYDHEAEADVDLVLSGHTHGGHLFPLGPIGLMLKANDRVYGTEIRNNTGFVVTSGISGWAVPFKTGTFSEFVVIDIKSKNY